MTFHLFPIDHTKIPAIFDKPPKMYILNSSFNEMIKLNDYRKKIRLYLKV